MSDLLPDDDTDLCPSGCISCPDCELDAWQRLCDELEAEGFLHEEETQESWPVPKTAVKSEDDDLLP